MVDHPQEPLPSGCVGGAEEQVDVLLARQRVHVQMEPVEERDPIRYRFDDPVGDLPTDAVAAVTHCDPGQDALRDVFTVGMVAGVCRNECSVCPLCVEPKRVVLVERVERCVRRLVHQRLLQRAPPRQVFGLSGMDQDVVIAAAQEVLRTPLVDPDGAHLCPQAIRQPAYCGGIALRLFLRAGAIPKLGIDLHFDDSAIVESGIE